MPRNNAFQMIEEMKEFATFAAAEQRYMRRTLDVAENGVDAAARWSRNRSEKGSIAAQAKLYRTLLNVVRATIPDDIEVEAGFVSNLVALTAFDLAEGKLGSFAAYRFLYERLLGAAVRPWLASAYVAAAALPSLHPSLRRALLAAITEVEAAPAGWSIREPAFKPEWVEKVPVTVS